MRTCLREVEPGPGRRYSWRSRTDRRVAVALLVFLAASAGTGVVSPHLRLTASCRLRLGAVSVARGGRPASRFHHLPGLAGLGLLGDLLGVRPLHLDVEQLLADVPADVGHHLAEDDEPLLLVLLLGVLLAVTA